MTASRPGRIIILNGAPRAGKSSIAAAIQAGVDGVWMIDPDVPQFDRMPAPG